MNILNEIKEFLDKNKIKYEIFKHEPTPTSELASKIRGTPLEQGAKAIVLRSRGKFFMCVLPGNRKINYGKVKKIIGSRKLSLATPEEVKEVTGCEIGGVPPFGNLFNIPLYVDRNLLKNEIIDFNAGLKTVSIEMKAEDYINITNAVVEDFVE